MAGDTRCPAVLQRSSPDKKLTPIQPILVGKRLIRDLYTFKLRFFQCRFRLQQLKDLLRSIACHPRSDRHHNPARFISELHGVGITTFNHRLWILHKTNKPFCISPLTDVLQIRPRQPPTTDRVAVHAVLAVVIRRVLCKACRRNNENHKKHKTLTQRSQRMAILTHRAHLM